MSMIDYSIVGALNSDQLLQLVDLFQQERWTKGRRLEDVKVCLANSGVVLGILNRQGELIAFSRVVTDFVYKGIACDIIVREDLRGTGLGKKLIDLLLNHPRLSNLRKLELFCAPDMIEFYEKYGFSTNIGELQVMRINLRDK